MSKHEPRPEITKGSGNVFADLGFPNPEEALLKAWLARQISIVIAQRGLTQVEVANLLGIAQPNVSALVNGRLGGFSVERLIRFLTALGNDVEIVVKPAVGNRGATRVSIVA